MFRGIGVLFAMVCPTDSREFLFERKIPVEVPLGRADGLQKNCVVNVDGITTIPKGVLDRRIGSLSKKKVEAINAAVRFALQLDS